MRLLKKEPRRRANGFSRKLRNHVAATALNYFAYNFTKIHRTLRMSPAMAADVAEGRVWNLAVVGMATILIPFLY